MTVLVISFLGHMNILAAVIFDEIDGQFSDACNKAIDNGLGKLLHPDWKKVFNERQNLLTVFN